jgi:hypothetical protein
MFTIVTSRTTISWARAITPRISQRREWCGSVLGVSLIVAFLLSGGGLSKSR